MKKTKLLSSIGGYNLAAKNYDQREGYLNSFEQGKLLSLVGNVKNKKILDVGAGTGRISVQLAARGAAVTALDISEEMLNKLKIKNSKIKIVVSDAENLPFGSGSFDVVVAAFFIVHLKDYSRFFDEVYRVLKDGGKFVLTNINQKKPPVVKTAAGDIIIESYYHRPEKVIETLKSLAFGIESETFVKEGETWINQIIVARK